MTRIVSNDFFEHPTTYLSPAFPETVKVLCSSLVSSQLAMYEVHLKSCDDGTLCVDTVNTVFLIKDLNVGLSWQVVKLYQ